MSHITQNPCDTHPNQPLPSSNHKNAPVSDLPVTCEPYKITISQRRQLVYHVHPALLNFSQVYLYVMYAFDVVMVDSGDLRIMSLPEPSNGVHDKGVPSSLRAGEGITAGILCILHTVVYLQES